MQWQRKVILVEDAAAAAAALAVAGVVAAAVMAAVAAAVPAVGAGAAVGPAWAVECGAPTAQSMLFATQLGSRASDRSCDGAAITAIMAEPMGTYRATLACN